MGGGSGVRAGYAYELPVLNGPYARELLRKQEERGLFQMEIPVYRLQPRRPAETAP